MFSVNKRDRRLSVIIITTVISFIISYICIHYKIDEVYRNLFYVPLLLSCFWYGKKGFYYSIGIIGIYLLFSVKYGSEPFWQTFISLIVFITIGFIIYRLTENVSEEEGHQNKIYQMSYSDYLTGVYNRRFIEEEIIRIDREENLPLSIIMGDVNGLKLFNDAFGHKKGDELIKSAAKAIKCTCRAGDIVARWGGDEFLVLLPKTKKEEAEKIVMRIKNTCNTMKFNSLSVSIALGWATKENQVEDLSRMLKIAEDYMYKHKFTESYSIRSNIIKTIFTTFQEKSLKLEVHSKRVGYLCEQMGKAMNLSEAEISELRISGLLHDIGKIAIDKSILNKSFQLTVLEWNEVKRHPYIGYRLLSFLPEMLNISQYVLYHHERFDGKGYPQGLKGEKIPLFSRIINVADSYDAMTNKRAYKGVLPKYMAIEELIRNKGTQFDPHIVDVFMKLLESHEASANG